MSKLKEKLEGLTEQYKDTVEKFQQHATLKTKLEGAIEFTQMLMNEEKEAEEKDDKKSDKGKK